MTLLAGAFLVLAAFVTATISGVLGMAGGLLLLGALLLVLPVAVAFVVHGLLPLVSNGWRAFLQRAHIAWRSVAWYAAGAAPRRAVRRAARRRSAVDARHGPRRPTAGPDERGQLHLVDQVGDDGDRWGLPGAGGGPG